MSVRYRAGVIGHTGRGDYGHGIDVAFLGLPDVEIIAVADPDPAGRQAAFDRTVADIGYADFREMLQRERLDLVAVCPRWLDQRVSMIEAAVHAGAHVFVEKPMAADLADADRIVEAADRHDRKVVVAHQGRLHPATSELQRLIADGVIGPLRVVRGYGKMDRRGGGQDLMVLGSHVLDAMRVVAGMPVWVSAELLVGSRLATPVDVRNGDEYIGPIAGDGLRATFGLPNDVIGLFESFHDLGQHEDLFGLDLVGERGQLSLRGGLTKRLLRYPRPYTVPGSPDDRWEPMEVPGAEPGDVPGDDIREADLFQRGNHRLVRDLIRSVEEGREPASSAWDARATLEMIQGISAAHGAGGPIELPLRDRMNPLGERWT
jgi:predicted dehydrogenase